MLISQEASRRSAGAPSMALLALFLVLPCAAAGQETPARSIAVPVRAPGLPYPVAVVTELSGQGTVRHAGVTQPLALLDTLAPDDEVRLAAGAAAQIVMTSGAQRVYALAGPGRCRVRVNEVIALEPRTGLTVRDLVGDWRAVRLRPGLVGRASVSLRGPGPTRLEPRAPVGAQRAAALDVLRWDAPPAPSYDRWQYSVSVIDEQGREVFSAQTGAAQLPLPHDLAWTRGAVYVWTVEAASEGGRRASGAAEFALIDAADEARIAAAFAAAADARARLPASAVPAEEVLLALLLDQAGLRDEADLQWRRLAQRNSAYASPGALAR